MHGKLLEVSDLTVTFLNPKFNNTVLENISFSLSNDQVLGIAGESGSGKTTLAFALTRIFSSQKADIKGHAFFETHENKSVDLLTVSALELESIRGKKISMIFQEPRSAFNPLFTCGNQIAETIFRHMKVSKSESVLMAKKWLAKTDLSEPERIFNSYPHQLSGGQLQRAMIAMALCCKPSLLIADEPLASSDYSNYQSLLNLFTKLKKETGMSIIFISHDLSAIEQIADSVLVLNNGRLIEQGPVVKIIQSPENAYTKQLIESRMDCLEKIKVHLHETVDQIEKAPVLKVQRLTKIFKIRNAITGAVRSEKIAVQDASFELFRGETLGITGDSGSGKTTLMRCICGLLQADGGEIFFNQNKIFPVSGNEQRIAAGGKIQIVFQNPDTSLNPKQTIGEAIMEPLTYYGTKSSIHEHKKHVLHLMEKAGLDSSLFDRFPHQLSGGQKQRAVIVRALVMKPEILICDEPVSSLDAVIQLQILKLLNDLKMAYGFSVIFISHNWPVVKFMSDRVMVMDKGTVKHIGNPEKVFELLKSDFAVC